MHFRNFHTSLTFEPLRPRYGYSNRLLGLIIWLLLTYDLSLQDHHGPCIRCVRAGKLLCCNACKDAYHLECLSPPIESLEGLGTSWYCPPCTTRRILRSLVSFEANEKFEITRRTAFLRQKFERPSPEKQDVPAPRAASRGGSRVGSRAGSSVGSAKSCSSFVSRGSRRGRRVLYQPGRDSSPAATTEWVAQDFWDHTQFAEVSIS